MQNVFLKPVLDGAGKPMLVRDPMTRKRLDPAGEWKPRIQYWTRRILQSDVRESEPEPEPAQAPSSPPAP
jgi:hypothetical protein